MTFLSQGTICAKKQKILFLQSLNSRFFRLECVYVNFGRDVVLDVVPIRDDQVSSPTSSRIQRVSDAFFCEHLCTKLMKTSFLPRRGLSAASNGITGRSKGFPNLLEYGDLLPANLSCIFRT